MRKARMLALAVVLGAHNAGAAGPGAAAVSAPSAAAPASPAASSNNMTFAVLAVGNCDRAGAGYAREFQAALANQVKESVLGEAEVVSALGGTPAGSLEAAQSLIESASKSSRASQTDEALEQSKTALAQLAALPPSGERYHLQTEGWALQALGQLRRGNKAEATRNLETILQVNPTWTPPKSFPPSFAKAVKEVSAALAKAPKGRLRVATQPEGLAVFVNGFEMAKAPFSTQLAQGNYRVEVGWGANRRGLPQDVHLEESASAEFDKDFDGAVVQDAGPCLEASGRRSAWVSGLVKLGGMLKVKRVVAVHVDEDDRHRQHLVATRIDVQKGEDDLEANFPIVDGREPAGAMEHLAAYLATGHAAPPPIEVTKGMAVAKPEAVASSGPNATSTPPAGGLSQEVPGSNKKGLRVASYVAGGVGVAALLGAGIFAYDARSAGKVLDSYVLPTQDGYRAGTAPQVGTALSRIDRDNKLMVGLGAAGGAALVTAVVLFIVSGEPPAASTQVQPVAGGVAFPIP